MTEKKRARCRDRARGLSAGHEDPVAGYSAQERSRRRARQHRHQGRGVSGLPRRCWTTRASTGPMPRSRACWSARWRRRASRSSSAPCCDATFGPMVMVGLGGITTELFRDVVYRPAPVGAAEAAAMLAELKAAPLLNGFRGAAKADISGAVATDRAGIAAGGATQRKDFRDRDQSGAGASRRARASPSSMRWWCGRTS